MRLDLKRRETIAPDRPYQRAPTGELRNGTEGDQTGRCRSGSKSGIW
jgi:hypothetical protein